MAGIAEPPPAEDRINRRRAPARSEARGVRYSARSEIRERGDGLRRSLRGATGNAPQDRQTAKALIGRVRKARPRDGAAHEILPGGGIPGRQDGKTALRAGSANGRGQGGISRGGRAVV